MPKWGRMCNWTARDDAMLLLGVHWCPARLATIRLTPPVTCRAPFWLLPWIASRAAANLILWCLRHQRHLFASCPGACRFGQNQWEAVARDERLGLRDKLAAAAAEKTLKKAGKKLTDKDSQLLPRGVGGSCCHERKPAGTTHACFALLVIQAGPTLQHMIRERQQAPMPMHYYCCCSLASDCQAATWSLAAMTSYAALDAHSSFGPHAAHQPVLIRILHLC